MDIKELMEMNEVQLSNECFISVIIFKNKYLNITYDIEDGKITRVYRNGGN